MLSSHPHHKSPRSPLFVAAVLCTIVLVFLLSVALASSAGGSSWHITFDLPVLLVLLVLAATITGWIREEDASFQLTQSTPTSSPRAPPAFFL